MQAIDKSFNSEYHFLLNCYSPMDIEMIATDLQMSFDNYRFLFIIDTYDIVENYLPYTDMELFSNRDLNFQAQKYICYDYFFGGFNKTNTILLEEYKIELLAAKNKLNRHLREANRVLKNLDKLKEETNYFLKDPDKTEAFFRNNFEIILLLLILNDKTNSILEEFFNFIKTRLSISEVKNGMDEDSELLTSIFSTCSHSRFSIEVFEKYISENKLKLLSVENHDERHVFLENTFRDIKVIERIMQINAALARKQLKYHAIYLSSAYKTADIFKVIDKMPLNSDPYSNEQRKKIHRNIYQYFLFDRIKTEYKQDIGSALKMLQSLRSLIEKLSNSSIPSQSANNENEVNEVLKVVKGLFDEKSGTIDNHFYLSVYERYKETFKNMLHSNTVTPLNKEELITIIKEVDKNKSIYKDRIFDLEFMLSQLNQTYDIMDSFQGIDEYEPEYRYGKDIIRNPYQHLPILLLMDNSFNSTLKQNLYSFLNTNIELKETDKSLLKQQLKKIVDELYKMEAEDVYSKFLKSLIITYLNLIAQAKQKASVTPSGNSCLNLEDSIIIDFEKQYEIIKLQFERIDHVRTKENNKIEYILGNHDLLIETAYALIWLYRRNDREDEGIRKGREILLLRTDDPRIYQGIALCYISKIYKTIKSAQVLPDEIHTNIDSAMQFLRMAKDKYQLLTNISSEPTMASLIMKNYIAVTNSLADILVRKHELNNKTDYTLIEMARQCINEIKALFDTIRLIYDDYPTYSATEFEIEYYEATHFYQSGEMSKAHHKVINAISRISVLNKMQSPIKYVDELFLKKESDLNELATTVFRYYARK